jgi:hypothetical protein
VSAGQQFFFCHRDGKLEAFKTAQALKKVFGDYGYVVSLVEELAKAAPFEGFDFVATWANNRVPCLERDKTVLLVVGDESGQVPIETNGARWVLRTGAKSSGPLFPAGQRPVSLCLLSSAREIRNLGLRFVRRLKGLPLATPRHVECLPMGLVGEIKLEPLAMPLRKWSLSFAGGIGPHHLVGKRRFPSSPKAAARLAMLEGLRRLSAAMPDLSYRAVWTDLEPALPRSEYHELLQQSRISLCPRGNVTETFRLCESARLGCAVICDPLPKCWYFDGHPFIELEDWRKLPELVSELMRDGNEISRRGDMSRQWWDKVASPGAVSGKLVGRWLQGYFPGLANSKAKFASSASIRRGSNPSRLSDPG